MYLTKSKIQKIKQCQKQLWLSENKPTLDETSEISKIIMNQGSEFGSLIKENFSNVFDIKEIQLEQLGLSANHKLLNNISDISKGKFFYPNNIKELIRTIKDKDNNFKVTNVAFNNFGKLLIIKSKSISILCYILSLIYKSISCLWMLIKGKVMLQMNKKIMGHV